MGDLHPDDSDAMAPTLSPSRVVDDRTDQVAATTLASD